MRRAGGGVHPAIYLGLGGAELRLERLDAHILCQNVGVCLAEGGAIVRHAAEHREGRIGRMRPRRRRRQIYL